MIEIAILDNTERLLSVIQPSPLPAVSPVAYQIGGLSMGVVFSADSTVASSLAQTLAKQGSPGFNRTYPSSDFTKYWLAAYTGLFPGNKTVLFDAVAETIAFDDTGSRGLVQIVTDNIGTVWAQSTVNLGLWKRTGVGTWTQMLTDTSIAFGVRYRASDNTFWYRSSSGNHYQIANGAATLQSAPTGTLVQVNHSDQWLSLDPPFLSNAPSFVTPPVFNNADGTPSTVPVLPFEAYINASTSGTMISAVQLRLDASYSLLIANVATNTFYALYLMNKVTGKIRFIGCLPPVALKGTVAATAAHMIPFAAKWTGNGFRVYFKGNTVTTASDATAGNQGGVIYVDVPYQPNF